MSWFKAGKDMTINGRVVTKSGQCHGTAYGVQEVSVGQHEWKIKAHNIGSSSWLFIGISADTSHSDTKMFNSTTTEHYVLYSYNGTLHSKNNPGGTTYANGGGIFTTGDTITVHLDLDKQQMSFSKNGNNIGIAFSNIVKTQKYRLAVEAFLPSTKFELISYTNLSSNKNEENKNEKEKMKQESKNIGLSETDEKTIELITQEMKEMRNEIGSLKDEIGSLKDDIKSLKEIILSNNKKVNDNNYYSNDDTKDVCVFLQDTVQLPQYIHAFIDAGFTNLASFASVTADDLKEMGCKLAHRHRILKAISKTWHK